MNFDEKLFGELLAGITAGLNIKNKEFTDEDIEKIIADINMPKNSEADELENITKEKEPTILQYTDAKNLVERFFGLHDAPMSHAYDVAKILFQKDETIIHWVTMALYENFNIKAVKYNKKIVFAPMSHIATYLKPQYKDGAIYINGKRMMNIESLNLLFDTNVVYDYKEDNGFYKILDNNGLEIASIPKYARDILFTFTRT